MTDPYPLNIKWWDELGAVTSRDMSEQWYPDVLVAVYGTLQDLLVEVELRVFINVIQGRDEGVRTLDIS